MRWSYKTIYYELRKDGLLGGSFLDEAEMEESLNEYGHAGWELVSIIEMKDGLIAFLKQPLDRSMQPLAEETFISEVVKPVPRVAKSDQNESSENDEITTNAHRKERLGSDDHINSFEEWQELEVEEKSDTPERKIGEIKIE